MALNYRLIDLIGLAGHPFFGQVRSLKSVDEYSGKHKHLHVGRSNCCCSRCSFA
jgi:hypothetical protein